MFRHLYTTLFLAFILICYATANNIEDKDWLNTTNDISELSLKALDDLKKESSIHVFDDLYITKVLQHRKTLAGSRRTVYMNLLVASMHYDSLKVEEMIPFIMIENNDKSGYQTYVTKKPVMKPSYVEELQKRWEHKQEAEVEL